MEPVSLHDLTAAYALDALDADEARAYEDHLDGCERCRAELAALGETASHLAWGAESPEPPARLRAAILDQAAAERRNVVPLPVTRTRLFRATAAVAAVAACAAVAFGVWAATLASRGPTREAVTWAVVVHGGHGTLTVSGLAAAPRGKTYEAWVIPAAGAPRPAGLFAGGGTRTVVRLTRPVPQGSTIAATLERAGGVSAPTTTPLFTARA
ncbi:MAG TPA: anti-sigma factor [Gaiellaceae bacterium]|nr:anti-sigma factor [Gaiellaceae bacterium]